MIGGDWCLQSCVEGSSLLMTCIVLSGNQSRAATLSISAGSIPMAAVALGSPLWPARARGGGQW